MRLGRGAACAVCLAAALCNVGVGIKHDALPTEDHTFGGRLKQAFVRKFMERERKRLGETADAQNNGEIQPIRPLEGEGWGAFVQRWTEESNRVNNGPCQSPAPNDKVIYVVRHGQRKNMPDPGDFRSGFADAQLSAAGETQAGALENNTNVAPALASAPGDLLIACSPLQRAMATALLGFGSLLPPRASWIVDPDLVEMNRGATSRARPAVALELLEKHRRSDLRDQYTSLPSAWAVQRGDWEPLTATARRRFRRFTENILKRPEHHIVMISHGHFLQMSLNMTWRMDEGQVVNFALSPDGRWRELSSPGCWPTGATAKHVVISNATTATAVTKLHVAPPPLEY